MAYARRTDNTHAKIRDELRQLGFSVADTSPLGANFPDLVAGKNGHDIKIECKTPTGRKTAAQRRSEGQVEFADEWKGSPVVAAYCVEDVLFAFSLHCKRHGWTK